MPHLNAIIDILSEELAFRHIRCCSLLKHTLNVTTLPLDFILFASGSIGGNRFFNILTVRSPSLVEKPSKTRCGYCSLTVPLKLPGISPRNTTLWSEKEAVGPWGK